MDDQDGSIFALLAAVASGGDDVQEDALAYRELPPQHIWSENALVDAWAAAMNEFKMYASSSNATVMPSFDREAQLLASPLWYAPQCPKPSSSSSSSSSKPAKRPLSADAAGYDGYQDEEEGEEEDDNEELADNDNEEEQVILVDEVVNTTIPSSTEYKRALPSHPPASHIHPSRLDHVPAASSNTDPYFNPAEWVPVERNSNSKTESNGKSTMEAPSVNDLKPSESEIVIPEPPSVEMAIPQEQALLDTQSPQEALEKALQAWYTAGYAAALYHVRSGAVKP